MSSAAPCLEFRAASKVFGGETALDRLSLTLQPGEILGFLGPNGAGKTTAIHLALGFLQPTSGGGLLLGRPFGDPEARNRLGFLPDVPAFFAETAASSVELAARLNDFGGPQLQSATRELLVSSGLPPEGKDARKFSRGMQQRLALAQALINDPELLILDEPTSALDPAGVQQMREVLRRAREEGKSIFFSSHQLTEVEQIADRIAFLRRGRLLRHGRLEEFLAESSRMEAMVRGLSRETAARLFPGSLDSAPIENSASANLLRLSFPIQEQKRIFESVWGAGGEILNATPVRGKLEDLFLAWSEDIGDDSAAGSHTGNDGGIAIRGAAGKTAP